MQAPLYYWLVLYSSGVYNEQMQNVKEAILLQGWKGAYIHTIATVEWVAAEHCGKGKRVVGWLDETQSILFTSLSKKVFYKLFLHP